MIVITGATGFVGEEVVKQAREAGYPVRAIVREPLRAQWLVDRYGVELFHGNVLYAPSIEGAMRDAKCVIHLVGIILRMEGKHIRADARAGDRARDR
jgi:dihydroflavonol-4-reductase